MAQQQQQQRRSSSRQQTQLVEHLASIASTPKPKWIIKKLHDARRLKPGKATEFLVEWEGYEEKTWEPKANLGDDGRAMLPELEKRLGHKWPMAKRGRPSDAEKSPHEKPTPKKKPRKSAAAAKVSYVLCCMFVLFVLVLFVLDEFVLVQVKKAMQALEGALEEALEEALNDRDRVMSVDECLKAVMASACHQQLSIMNKVKLQPLLRTILSCRPLHPLLLWRTCPC